DHARFATLFLRAAFARVSRRARKPSGMATDPDMATGGPQPRHRWRRPSRRALALAVAVAIAAVAVLVLLWDWNWFKGPIVRIVDARTGRSLDILGDPDYDLRSL